MTETSTAPTFTPTTPMPPPPPRQLLRRRPRILGGVSAGLAEYAGLPLALVRVLFVVTAFMGWGLLLYPVLWLVIPDER